jgi:hypothetical protein
MAGSRRTLACAAVLAALAAATGVWMDPVRAARTPDSTVALGVAGAANSGASLAAAGSSVVVTWAARTESATDIYAAFSGDGGATFGAPRRVNDVPGDARVSGEQGPRVALGRGVQVVWISRRNGMAAVRTAAARPGEQTFAPATTVHAENLGGARGWPSLAVDAGGRVHVAWLDGRGDAPADPAAAAASPAPMRKATRQDIFQAVWRPDGTHDEARLATDVCFCCKTAVATAPDGSVYVAWRHIYPPNLRDMAVARSTDGGRTFGAPVRVSEDGWAIDLCPDDGPSIVADARGVLHIAWPTMVGEEDKGIFYSYSTDGGRTFATRQRVDGGSAPAAHPQLALSGDRVVVLWDQGPAPRRAYLREISSGAKAAAWKPSLGRIVNLSGDGAAVYPVAVSTPSGLVAAWTSETPAGSEVRVRRLGR